MKTYMSAVLVTGAITLIGWLMFWGSAYIDASDSLLSHYQAIAREYDPVPYVAELGPEENKQLVEQMTKTYRETASDARATLSDAHSDARHAKFMLTTVPSWMIGLLLLMSLGIFLSRYRLRLDRRSIPTVESSSP